MSSNVSTLVGDLRDLLRGDDPEQYNREKLRETCRKLSIELETPGESVYRICYLPLITNTCRIATKLDLFRLLVESDGPRSGTELAQKTGADHALLVRLLRFLAANEIIEEVGEDAWAPSSITKNLTVPSSEGGLNFLHDTVSRIGSVLPAFLEETKYKNPTDSQPSPFQYAFKTAESTYAWLSKHPECLHNFTLWMTGQRMDQVDWLDFFPFEERVLHSFRRTEDAVLIVDVGGGVGHVLESILHRYPGLEGRLVLQDQPDLINKVQSPTIIEPMVHDFFTPQQIKGAHVYHLRNILHNWGDDQCQNILKRIAAVMEKGYSKILINEVVLPNRGVSLRATQLDMTMMCLVASLERTEKQWRELLESAGLKIEGIWTESTEKIHSIIEVVLP